MNSSISSKALKSKSKGLLLGKYGTVIPAFLIVESITVIITFAIANTINTSSLIGLILYYAITFLLQLLSGIFAVGEARLCLNISCNFPHSINDVFYGFKNHTDKTIKIQFFLALIQYACLLPYLILNYMVSSTGSLTLKPYVSLFMIIGYLASLIIMLTYSQVFYLILDFPQHSAKELLRMSKTLMKGYKGSLFYLDVSFVPLLLLSILSCGIGLLWIMPYMRMTMASFYLDLIKIKSAPPLQ